MVLTYQEWLDEGTRRFGDNEESWRFVCPSCGHVASVADWREARAPSNTIAFSCIGRFTGDPKLAAKNAFQKSGGPCNYAGGGLIKLNPVIVTMDETQQPIQVFAFAD